jgi:hypothetical protein
MAGQISYYFDKQVPSAIGYLIRSLQLIAQVITPDEMRGHVEFL